MNLDGHSETGPRLRSHETAGPERLSASVDGCYRRALMCALVHTSTTPQVFPGVWKRDGVMFSLG